MSQPRVSLTGAHPSSPAPMRVRASRAPVAAVEQLASPHTGKRAELEAAGWTFRQGTGNPSVHVAQHGTGKRSLRMFGDSEAALFQVLQWRQRT